MRRVMLKVQQASVHLLCASLKAWHDSASLRPASSRPEGLPLQGTMVSGEEEEENCNLWPLGVCIVQLGTISQTHLEPSPYTASLSIL